MPLLTRKRAILAKIETSYGVDSSPATANSMLVKNLQITPIAAEVLKRDLVRPYYGNDDVIIANQHVQAEFEVEIAGSGAAGTAPAYGPLLRACGFGQTVTASTKTEYKPISGSFESVTIYVNIDGALHKMTGSRGTVEINMQANQIPHFKFTMQGIYNAVADSAMPTTDFAAFVQPLPVNMANTPTANFFSTAVKMEQLTVNVANNIQYVERVGSKIVHVTDRQPTGQIVFEAPTIGTKDFWSTATGRTYGALQVVHGTTAGNIVDVSMSRVDIQQPNYSDANDILMLTVPFVPLPTQYVGNDEMVITVK